MDDSAWEQRLLDLAVAQGLLISTDIPPPVELPPDATLDPTEQRFGLRVARLLKSERLRTADVERLAATLESEPNEQPRAVAAADPPVALAPTLPGKASKGGEDGAFFPDSARLSSFLQKDWYRYEFLRLLGQGGMGVVYAARDRKLGRKVALKFLLGVGEAQTQRFLQEARAQARLHHANICEVYEVGEVDGRSYIAMQLVEGQSLQQAAPSLSLVDKIQLLRVTALAVHEAHRLGIIHRDLKPSNIMVERVVDGSLRPVVMDFGLARESGENQGLTESGAVIGTPAYMPPEQARGQSRHLDRRADVYSLGATLYELLTGGPPFKGQEVVDVILAVLNEDPKPLRTLLPELPADLETITLKCLAKEPAQRYDSTRALAEDLERYIDGEPILGRRPSLRYRLRRFVRRNKGLVALSALAALITLTLGGFGIRSELGARAQAQLAQELGQDIKESELFMRAAYGLPLHDMAREQAVVRSRMKRLADKLPMANARSAAALRYALGRGHLVLREYSAAQTALEQGWRAGYRTPEARLALGLTLVERYRQELESAEHTGERSFIEARDRELSQQYLAPALSYLEGANGSVEAPAYIAGLVAFYRKDYDLALRLALQAQQEAPWLAEPLKLEGDVYRTRGSQLQRSGKTRDSRPLFVRAAERHHAAVAISRSDLRLYDAEAEDWIRVIAVDATLGRPFDEATTGVLAATEHALVANARAPHSLRLRAYAHSQLQARKRLRGQDPAYDLKQMLELAERAMALDPSSWESPYYYGIAIEMQASDMLYHQGNLAEEQVRKAIKLLQQALSINKNLPFAWSEIGDAYTQIVFGKIITGVFDQKAFAEAAFHYARAFEVDPGFSRALLCQGTMYISVITFLASHGETLEKEYESAMKIFRQALNLKKDDFQIYLYMVGIQLVEIDHLISSGASPDRVIKESLQTIARVRELNHVDVLVDIYAGNLHSLRALSDLEAGRDPMPAVEEGLQAIRNGMKKQDAQYDLLRCKSRLHLIAARSQSNRERAEALFAESLAASELAVKQRPKMADAYDGQCEAIRYTAESRLNAPGLKPEKAAELTSFIDRGLAACSTALVYNPTSAYAHGNRGTLLLLAAQQATSAPARKLGATQAVAALEKALQINKWLQREYSPLLAQAKALADAQSPTTKEGPRPKGR
ncbi:MAG: serine/threonine protein kinase [Myxococcales bacterium]|nr:serine/threonine protein kinase [Myxococcales bacterium]